MNELTDLWGRYLNHLDFDESVELKNNINYIGLKEVVNRVFQRYDYFYHFHNGMHMSEYKEIALYAFWLVKLKPFSLELPEKYSPFALKINEEFAVYFILTALAEVANTIDLKFNNKHITKELYNEMVYTLLFRDVSKEALSLIVELLAHCVIEGIEDYKRGNSATD